MSDLTIAQVQQLRESMAHTIAHAVLMADRLGLMDVAAILREAEIAAKHDGEDSQGPDWRSTLR